MMRTMLVLLVFCCVASAQTTINVYSGQPQQTMMFPAAAAAGYGYAAAPSSGCHGSVGMTIYRGSGCTGSVRMAGSGCTGSAGGVGYVAQLPGYQTTIPVYMAPAAAPTTYAAVPVTYGAVPGNPVRYGVSPHGDTFVYGRAAAAATGAPVYGEMTGRGKWATPSGKPPAPGIVSIPDAPWPLDGPIRRGLRAAFGFDY